MAEPVVAPVVAPMITTPGSVNRPEGVAPAVTKSDVGSVVRREESVEVLIEGQKYVVKSDLNADSVRQIASHVDRIMKEIKRRSPNVSPTKVAILAALNIAEELFRLKESCGDVLERSAELVDLIDQLCSRHAGAQKV